jgi:hypothetical protein
MYNELSKNGEIMKTALDILIEGKYTCVLKKGDFLHASAESGLKPMLGFIRDGIDLRGFSAADKVVGKAAAFLFVLAGVQCVHGVVMSVTGLEVLSQHGIVCTYDKLVDQIQRRDGMGVCPMELRVRDIDDPNEALRIMKS